jgi:putative two-component system response regulator
VTETVAALLGRLRTALPAEDVNQVVDEALATCRRLYGSARSKDALPLAQAALEQCTAAGDYKRIVRAATACGLLVADLADVVAAIGYHVQALRVAMAADDRIEMSRTWNNIGYTVGFTGNHAMAVRCYERALALVAPRPEPVYSRYTACSNLAANCFQLGRIEEGLVYAKRALAELVPELYDQDLYGVVLLHRNLVWLHVAAGNLDEAGVHAAEALAVAQKCGTERAQIAADISRASYEVAAGRSDVALTRLDQVLARARELPPALRETLVCVIRAEEKAGNVARALMRLEELSDHIYDLAIERVRSQVELSNLREQSALDLRSEQDRARLISKLEPRSAPESWKALQRLAVSAAMRLDESGWHGRRVGAMTKALATAMGMPPLQALEIGLAAELHDIGMLSVPEAILAKPGMLNDSERSIVQRHAEAGARMLRDDGHPMVFLAREIATYHHARWDGTGYPERVAGKFIPIAARMCAVADAYDAMVCGIGGRPPRTMGEALEELRRGAGSQFDPEVVSCFDVLVRSELEDRGVDLEAGPGMEDFQELVLSLKEDRGFV